MTVAPAAPRLINRGDLVAALDRAAARRVTIISAPAGSGKTSLLRAWAGRPGQPGKLAVLQVRRDQQDAQQFWLALLDAVRRASATTGREEPSAATPGFNGQAMVGTNKVSVSAKKKTANAQKLSKEAETQIKGYMKYKREDTPSGTADYDASMAEYIPPEWGSQTKETRVIEAGAPNDIEINIKGPK